MVANDQLDDAIAAISRAGLPPCSCKSLIHHSRDEGAFDPLPVHFSVPAELGKKIIYLCPNDVLLNLIPLTPQHPNPAALTWRRVDFELYSSPFYSHKLPPNFKGARVHPINVLDTQCLLRALLLLCVFAPPRRQGLVYHYVLIAGSLVLPEHAQYETGSPSLDRLCVYFTGPPGDPRHYPAIVDEVKKEWQGRIVLDGHP